MFEAIEEVRGAGLFAGTMSPEQLEAETGWTYRTRQRREAEGMPVLKVGNVKRYPIPEVREWIRGHIHQRVAPPPAPPPGRPPGRASAVTKAPASPPPRKRQQTVRT